MSETFRGVLAGGVVFAAVAGIAADAAAQDDPIYRFPKDKVVRYVLKENFKFSYKADAGKQLDTESKETTFEVHSDTDAPGATLQVKYRDIKLARMDEEGKFAVDSRKKYSIKTIAKDQRLGVFVGLIGDGFVMSVDSKGDVRVGDVEWMVHRATTRGLVGDYGTVAAVSRQVARILSTGVTLEGMGAAFMPMPTNVSKGDTWQRELQTKIAGVIFHQKFVYRATSVKKGKIAIHIGGVYEISVDGTALDQKGTLKGSAAFDNNVGRLLLHKYTASIKLPNMQMTDSLELKYLKELDPKDAGPESFEQPLRPAMTLVERRLAKGYKKLPTFIYPDLETNQPNAFACKGDTLRVIGKDDATGKLKVVTPTGRVGWALELQTEKTK